MRSSFPCLVVRTLAAGLFLTAPAVHAQLDPGVTPFANRAVFETAAANAGSPAVNTFGFEELNLADGTAGPNVQTLTEAGFVVFRLDPTTNYTQRIINGFNVGQVGNDVYNTQASNLAGTVADVTFAAGVFSLGFDLKNTANNLGPSQPFTLNLFTGGEGARTSLGSLPVATNPDGRSFTFTGFVSDQPITELTITGSNGLGSMNVVLDNFAVANPVPEPGTVALLGVGGLLLGGLAAGRARRRTV